MNKFGICIPKESPLGLDKANTLLENPFQVVKTKFMLRLGNSQATIARDSSQSMFPTSP